MFGFVDRFFVKRWNSKSFQEKWDWKPEVVEGDSDEVWYCFVPSEVMNSNSLKSRLVPAKGAAVVYTSSYRAMIFSDANKTKRIFEKIYRDAKERMLKDFKKGKKINLAGISLGNIFSVRLAHDIPEVKRFISIVGGVHPGRVAWHSIATSWIVRKSKYKSAKEYGEAIAEFAPLRYFENLHVDKIFARFGGFDLIVPYNPYGKELKNALKNLKASSKDIKTYWWADHVTSIFLASKEKMYDKLK